jgi:hypothetical protein
MIRKIAVACVLAKDLIHRTCKLVGVFAANSYSRAKVLQVSLFPAETLGLLGITHSN